MHVFSGMHASGEQLNQVRASCLFVYIPVGCRVCCLRRNAAVRASASRSTRWAGPASCALQTVLDLAQLLLLLPCVWLPPAPLLHLAPLWAADHSSRSISPLCSSNPPLMPLYFSSLPPTHPLQLTGIAAILRFPLPDLEDQEFEAEW